MSQFTFLTSKVRKFKGKPSYLRLLPILSLFILLFVASCQRGSGPDETRNASVTVNLSANLGGVSSSVAGPNYNALGTIDDVVSVTTKVIETNNNLMIKLETPMTESTPGAGDWSLTFTDLPTETKLKFLAKAYNASGTAIFEDTTVQTFSTSDTNVNIEFQMESIDDGIHPTNPRVVSATIPSSIYTNTMGAMILFDVSHDSDIYYEISVIKGAITSSASGTHDPTGPLPVAYTAPGMACEDTITIKVRNASSTSEVISMSYPITITDEPITSTVNHTVLFGPAITGMNFTRTNDTLSVTALVTASTNITYSWSGQIDFDGVSSDTNQVVITPYSDTDAGKLVISVTDENGIEASLTRPIDAGAFEVNVITTPEPDRTLPDTNQVTSYTTTFGEDSDYGIPHNFIDNGNGTVTDNETHLIWQQEDDDVDRTFADAVTYCENATFGGITNWRLPYLKELESIVDYENNGPAVDSSFFHGTNTSGGGYWTNTEKFDESSYTQWCIDFSTGTSQECFNTSYTSPTRCVSSDSSTDLWGGDFIFVSDETVYHSATRLIWQRTDNDTIYNWEQAIAYCEDLTTDSFSDWRLPNIRELISIVDYTTRYPAIDSTIFPGTNWDSGFLTGYWSSTTQPSNPLSARVVNYSTGYFTYMYKDDQYVNHVRCVRGGE